MHNLRGGKPADKRVFSCPQCDKMRMVRLPDHVVSKETKAYETFDKKEVTLYIDICDFCMAKNKRKHFEPSAQAIRSMLRAIRDSSDEEGPSLEDLL